MLIGRIGNIISITILTILVFVTLKLSGHRHSLGILVIGLITINILALVLLMACWQFKMLKSKFFFIYVSIVFVLFFGFIIFHNSYDSYNETRNVLWSFNGEVNSK